jgi:hypothetical protein
MDREALERPALPFVVSVWARNAFVIQVTREALILF